MENLKTDINFNGQTNIFSKLREIILKKKDVQLAEHTDTDIKTVLTTGEREFCGVRF